MIRGLVRSSILINWKKPFSTAFSFVQVPLGGISFFLLENGICKIYPGRCGWVNSCLDIFIIYGQPVYLVRPCQPISDHSGQDSNPYLQTRTLPLWISLLVIEWHLWACFYLYHDVSSTDVAEKKMHFHPPYTILQLFFRSADSA